MKFRILFRLFIPLFLLISMGAFAQSAKEKKKTASYEQLKAHIDARQYTFNAQTATSMSGRTRQLTSPYSLKVHQDTLDVDLPYFGRAYSATPGDTNGGINFTSTSFSYEIKDAKNNGWLIEITPKNERNATKINLNISSGGYATLLVTSNYRQIISFYGKISGNEQTK